MSQVLNLRTNEMALGGVELEPGFAVRTEHLVQPLRVLLNGRGVHQHVVDISQGH